MTLIVEIDHEPTDYELDLLRAWWVRCPLADAGSRLVIRVRGQLQCEYLYSLMNGTERRRRVVLG
jgi:hypothetical protein